MLAQHDLLSSSVQRLKNDTGARNGHMGDPSVIGRRRSTGGDETDSFASLRGDSLSSKKMKRNEDILGLSENIHDYKDAMVGVAKMNAGNRKWPICNLSKIQFTLEVIHSVTQRGI